jgi:hypothetical protein
MLGASPLLIAEAVARARPPSPRALARSTINGRDRFLGTDRGLPRPGEPARYYLECTLSKLHGVRFGPDDYIEDKAHARSPEVVELRGPFERLEWRRIVDAKPGLLDRFAVQAHG